MTTTFVPVALVAASVLSPAGNGALAQLAACVGQQGSGKPDPTLTAMSPVHHKPMPVLAMCCAEIRPRDPAARITALLEAVLLDAAATLPEGSDWSRVLLYFVLPPEQTTRGKRVRPEAIRAHFTALDPVFAQAAFRFARDEDSVSASLAEAVALAGSGAHSFVFLAVADTLLDPFTCAELEERIPLQTAREPHGTSGSGLIPSEAGAALVLAPLDGAPPCAPLGILSGLGSAPEPHPLKPDLETMVGLPQAVAAALAAAKCATEEISGALLPIGTEPLGLLEWNQTAQRLWPLRISEQQRAAVELDEVVQPEIPPDTRPETLFAAIALGETGTAALPVLVATAGAWLCARDETGQAERASLRRLLVMETGITPYRGAVVLDAPSSQGHP